MNKKLLALAIGAAVAMPVAALADGPTLYGKINLALENNDDGTDDVWSVVNNASRVGIKGSAETGVEGLKGLYQVEVGVSADDGDFSDVHPFTGRQIFAGLNGDFGTVLVGNIDTPTRSAQGKVDQFNDTSYDMGGYVAGELRAPNVVAYASPKIADSVTVTVALWQAEGNFNDTNGDPLVGIGDAVSASVVYEKDSLYLALGMDKDVPTTGAGVDLDAPALSFYNDIMRAVAGYSTDTFEVGFLYQTAEDTNSDAQDTSMVLSGAYKTGDWKFKGQYGTTDGDQSNNTVTALAIGADYALGKATTVGAFYGSAEDDNSTFEDTTLSFNLEQRF